MNADQGRLTVTTEDTRLTSLGVLYTIKDKNARPVISAALGDPVDLDPGFYVIEVPMPSGDIASESLEVNAGSTEELTVPITGGPRTPGIIIEDGARKFDLTGYFPNAALPADASIRAASSGEADRITPLRVDLQEPRGIDLEAVLEELQERARLALDGDLRSDEDNGARTKDRTVAPLVVGGLDFGQIASSIEQALQDQDPDGLGAVIGAFSTLLGGQDKQSKPLTSASDGTPLTFRLRFPGESAEAAAPAISIEASVRGNGALAVTAAVCSMGGRPPIVEVARQGSLPTATVLPLLVTDASPRPECNLVITATKDDVELDATPAPGTRAQLAAEYLQSSDRKTASTILGGLEDLVAGKEGDPIAAALSCYALLRLREHDRLHDWPSVLASRFPEMPDGAIIAGELALRRGDDKAAKTWIRQALGGRPPIFTDGFTILLSLARTLELLREVQTDDVGNQSPHDHGTTLPDPATVDFDKLTLTWRTQATSIDRFPTRDGWRRFRHRTHLLDPQDWWR